MKKTLRHLLRRFMNKRGGEAGGTCVGLSHLSQNCLFCGNQRRRTRRGKRTLRGFQGIFTRTHSLADIFSGEHAPVMGPVFASKFQACREAARLG